MENLLPSQTSPQIISVEQIISSNNSTSFFSKIFEYKYLILLLIVLISISYYYYTYHYKQKKQLSNSKLQDFIVADMNGKVIKISGEQIGELRVPSQSIQPVPQNQTKQSNIQESTDEDNNIKQHDLTNSEIRDITNKLKN
jgi:hypothetical protein